MTGISLDSSGIVDGSSVGAGTFPVIVVGGGDKIGETLGFTLGEVLGFTLGDATVPTLGDDPGVVGMVEGIGVDVEVGHTL